MQPSSTDDLLKKLLRTDEYTQFQADAEGDLQVPSLTEHLNELLIEKKRTRAEVIATCNLDKTYGYQIFQGIRQPTRDKLLQLAFGFPLTYQETIKMLRIAGVGTLYPKRKRDSIIIFALHKRLTMQQLSTLLAEEGEAYLA